MHYKQHPESHHKEQTARQRTTDDKTTEDFQVCGLSLLVFWK